MCARARACVCVCVCVCVPDLEVVRKFLTAGVSRIHRDEDGTGRVEYQLGALEHELLDALSDRYLYAEDLLRYHRQHFELNPVKLIETGPRASLRQTLKELTHRLVVESVRTVEHDTLRPIHKQHTSNVRLDS